MEFKKNKKLINLLIKFIKLIKLINLKMITLFSYYYLSLSYPYYYNPNIHNFGNIGIGGKIHANLSPFATKMIDVIRYNNKNIRHELMSEYKNDKILDLCCGIGISTYDNSIGIDTSHEMLNVAKRINTNKTFYYGNSETYKPNYEIDIVSCMFSFHEMPNEAHYKIIDNAFKIAKKEIIIVDISPNYNPSKIMITGEPYLNNYLKTISNVLDDFEETILIPHHVHVWKYVI